MFASVCVVFAHFYNNNIELQLPDPLTPTFLTFWSAVEYLYPTALTNNLRKICGVLAGRIL